MTTKSNVSGNGVIVLGIISDVRKGMVISDALAKRYTKRHFILPINDEFLDIEIRDMALRPKHYESLKNAHIVTVGDLVDSIENGLNITHLEGISDKGGIRIFEELLNCGFSCLSPLKKKEFIQEFVDKNNRYLKPEYSMIF